MITAADAQEIILKNVTPQEREEVALAQALHRYLAEPVVAPIDLPPFDNAAMDGFAVRCGDLQGALENPIKLEVVGSLFAGGFTGGSRPTGELCPADLPSLNPGQAIRIMTGAPIPSGADAVVPFEECQTQCMMGVFTRPATVGSHIRRRAEDVKAGTQLLQVGEKITSRVIGLLAALGMGTVAVFRKPSIKVLTTGAELVSPGNPLPPGKIYNSNLLSMVAALGELGLAAEGGVTISDVASETEQALQQALDADVILTVGGVSAGDYDFVPKVLKKLGATIHFHKVAIKPGKPLLFATIGTKFIFGLPGNPVSAWIVFDRFVRPALLKMMGARSFPPQSQTAVAEEELKGSKDKVDYLRGVVSCREGRYFARSAGQQGSAHLLPLVRANAILTIPADRGSIAAGEAVEVELLEQRL